MDDSMSKSQEANTITTTAEDPDEDPRDLDAVDDARRKKNAIYDQVLDLLKSRPWCNSTGNDDRLSNLSIMFQFKKLLEDDIAASEKSLAAVSSEEVVKTKRGGKFTSAQLAAIRSVVQQEQQDNGPKSSSEIRLMKDRMDAAEVQLKKTENRLKNTEAENEALRRKITAWGDVDCLREEMNGLSRRLIYVENAVKEHRQGQAALANRVVEVKEQGETAKEELEGAIARLTDELAALRFHFAAYPARDTDGVERGNTRLRSIAAGASIGYVHSHETLLREIATVYEDLREHTSELKERILEVEERQEQQSADYAALEESVGGIGPSADESTRREVNRMNSKIGRLRGDLTRAVENAKRIDENVFLVEGNLNQSTERINDHLARIDQSVGIINSNQGGDRGRITQAERRMDENIRWRREIAVPGLQTLAARAYPSLQYNWSEFPI